MIVVGAALSVAVLGGIGLKLMGGSADASNAANTPPMTALATSTATATSAPATAVPTIAPAPDANAETRTVKLVIIPDEAEVKSTAFGEGEEGHRRDHGQARHREQVTLTIGKETIEEEVVVTDSGALPPKLELERRRAVAPNRDYRRNARHGCPTTPKGIDTSFQ